MSASIMAALESRGADESVYELLKPGLEGFNDLGRECDHNSSHCNDRGETPIYSSLLGYMLGTDVKKEVVQELSFSEHGCSHGKALPSNNYLGSTSLGGTPRLADDNNYMLRSSDSRPRSASLSQVSKLNRYAESLQVPTCVLVDSAKSGNPQLVPMLQPGLSLASTSATPMTTTNYVLQEAGSCLSQWHSTSVNALVSNEAMLTSVNPSLRALVCICRPNCCCQCPPPFSFTDCQTTFHTSCATSFTAVASSCSNGGRRAEPSTAFQNVSVNQWSTTNVVEWMAAVNLYRYAELFRSKDIKGVDLLSLDKEKLISMGIKDEFHQQAILVCVEELCQRAVTIRNGGEEIIQGQGPSLTQEPFTDAHGHSLVESSFSAVEKCGKCYKFLRGLFRQGLLCHACGLISHRTCAATGLPACIPSEKNRIQNTVFGVGLCRQWEIADGFAPPLLMRLTSEVESGLLLSGGAVEGGAGTG